MLREYRDRAGLTNAALAELTAPAVSMTPKSLREDLSRFERGNKLLRRDVWSALILTATTTTPTLEINP